jgi:hypothetical protein
MTTSETSSTSILDLLESQIDSLLDLTEKNPNDPYNEGQYDAYSYVREWIIRQSEID